MGDTTGTPLYTVGIHIRMFDFGYAVTDGGNPESAEHIFMNGNKLYVWFDKGDEWDMLEYIEMLVDRKRREHCP